MVVSINHFVKTFKLNSLTKASLSSNLNFFKHISSSNRTNLAQAVATSAQTPIPPPHFEGQPKEYPPKIQQLVEEIAKLNLIEVSDLNELLRKKLNIKDVAMSFAPSGAMNAGSASGGAVAAAPKEEEEAEAPKAVKTSFKLKLVKYDEAKKVALIKEVKALGDNMNLVQAKKFIESVPQVFRDNISKEEADKLKAQLEKVGATMVIE
jgi:large subunit ribosomal protein L7/L12